MVSPGEYVADVTEGVTCVADLPKPKIKQRSRVYKKRPCPVCGHWSYRDKIEACQVMQKIMEREPQGEEGGGEVEVVW